MSRDAKRRSLWSRMPDYRVELEPDPRRVRVRVEGEVVADSRRTLLVQETNHDAVIYFPLEDLRRELISRSDHGSFCPFKGEASYWTLRIGDHVVENAIWGYESPFEEVAGLAGFVAFYADHVEYVFGD